jgi:hypothetical protein
VIMFTCEVVSIIRKHPEFRMSEIYRNEPAGISKRLEMFGKLSLTFVTHCVLRTGEADYKSCHWNR